MQIVSKGLKFAYNKKTEFCRQALQGVDLTIDSGDFFGIIGQTGSGKSTFIQHINGLIPVQEGTLRVGEYDLSLGIKSDKKMLKELRRKVGMVFQYPEYQLFAESVYEDVAFGFRNFNKNFTKEEELLAVANAITSVGLNFNEVYNKSPFDLSGGQKRRVALAGVLVTKPEILILDEPVAGLDPVGKKELMLLLHKLHKTAIKTIVIVSHDMDEVCENCSKVAIFSKGKCVKVDSPKNLFMDYEEIQSLRLDVPLTSKLTLALEKTGVKIDSDFTTNDFIKKVVEKYKESKK